MFGNREIPPQAYGSVQSEIMVILKLETWISFTFLWGPWRIFLVVERNNLQQAAHAQFGRHNVMAIPLPVSFQRTISTIRRSHRLNTWFIFYTSIKWTIEEHTNFQVKRNTNKVAEERNMIQRRRSILKRRRGGTHCGGQQARTNLTQLYQIALLIFAQK